MSTVTIPTPLWSGATTRCAATSASLESASTVSSNDRKWRDRYAELALIGRYIDDWDGEGSSAPNPKILASASDFLKLREGIGNNSPPTSVAMSPAGSIIFFWHFPHQYVEAEINAVGCEWLLRTDDKTECWTEFLAGEVDAPVELSERVWMPNHQIGEDGAVSACGH